MAEFFQDPPVLRNRFQCDLALRYALERALPAGLFAEAAANFDRFGQRCVTEFASLAEQAEREPPRHVPFDVWGRRIDRIESNTAFDALVRHGQEEGLVAIAFEADRNGFGRVLQAGLVNLFGPVSALATCPLAMTDSAATVLKAWDPLLSRRYGRRLIARRDAITSGQWMTETSGGSDVTQVATRAVADGDGSYKLYGTKSFASAISTDIALVLARTENADPGTAGLSLFVVELRRPDGGWNALTVRRLKDKLGTKALTTAELDLQGSWAMPVGDEGRGVAKVASMLNVARVWAAYAGTAAVGHLLSLARDYATRRVVFGRRLIDLPMHRAWLAQIAAEYEAMVAISFETAQAFGRAQQGNDGGLARLYAPLAKFACARGGINGASELLESFGGAGYLEDTGLPRILRNAQVNVVWEGTSTVLAQDVLRALRRHGLGEEWLSDMHRRLSSATHDELQWVKPRIIEALGTIRPLVLEPDERDGRRLAAGMARVTQATLLTEAAEWRIVQKDDRSALIATELLTRAMLVPPPSADMDLHALAFGAFGQA